MSIVSSLLYLLVPLGALLVSGVPIALSLAAAGLFFVVFVTGAPLATAAATIWASLDSLAILAIPFFILAAELLARGGAIGKLIDAVDALIGHISGGLPLVAVISVMIFSAICGSSLATAAAIGTVVIPAMVSRGYSKRFSTGLVAAAGGLGILIPPSVPMIIYSIISGTSIAAMFNAGVIPGLFLGACLGIYGVWRGSREVPGSREPASWEQRRQALRRALPILFMPVFILGSIYSGILTPMESSALAVVYAIIITIPEFAKKGIGEVRRIIAGSCTTSAAVLIILGGASIFSYGTTISGVPQWFLGLIRDLDMGVAGFLVMMILFWLAIGLFLEVISVILITCPIVLPIVIGLGIDPLYFGIVMILAMEAAVITPPIGLNLFAISSLSRTPISEVFYGTIPCLGIILATLMLFTFLPIVYPPAMIVFNWYSF